MANSQQIASYPSVAVRKVFEGIDILGATSREGPAKNDLGPQMDTDEHGAAKPQPKKEAKGAEEAKEVRMAPTDRFHG